MNGAAITLEKLALAYESRPVVRNVDGCFTRGSLTAIVGPNGAGKSTLLKAIMGLLDPMEGRIERHGADCRRDFAYLPQRADIDSSFPITVGDVVAAGAWHEIGAFGGVAPMTKRRLDEALTTIGLEGFARRVIASLSVGQFQRVLFARLLLQQAPVILLDEPFNAIDARTTNHLMGLVQDWHSEGKTVIAVLHDFDQVRRFFPLSLLLARELIAWGPTEEVLTPANLVGMHRSSESWDEDVSPRYRRAS